MSERFELGEWDGLEWAEVDELDRLLQRRRWGLGLAAAVLSLLLHGVLWWRFPHFFLGPLVPERLSRLLPPVTLTRLEREPPSIPKDTAGSLAKEGEMTAMSVGFEGKEMDESKLVPPPPPAVRIGPSEWMLPSQTPDRDLSPWHMISRKTPEIMEAEPERRILPPSPSVPPPDIQFPISVRSFPSGDGNRVLSMALEEILDLTNAPAIPFSTSGWQRIEEAIRPSALRADNTGGGRGESGVGLPAFPTTEENRPGPSGPPLTPVEDRLRAELRIWKDRREPEFVYTRVEIRRAGPEVLPVLSKDLLLIQDTSASITEERLEYCRQGLLRILGQLRPGDRFNILQFKDRPQFCFPTWMPVNPANVEEGRQFILSMVSQGLTDIAASLDALSSLKVEKGRPAIAILATDGLPTHGERDSAAILSEFTQRNGGALSVFVLAVHDQANMYLLDMLSYMNRGDTLAARRGRWTIPDTMDRLHVGLSRPVLTGMELRFAGSGVECFPVLSPNLYLDRPLVFYGRYPANEKRVVFQVAGQAGDQFYDMVFDLPMEGALRGDESIREEWAWHKIYTLIGRHAVAGDPQALRELAQTARRYGLSIPYGDRLPAPSAP